MGLEMTLKGYRELEAIGAIKSLRNQRVGRNPVKIGDILTIPHKVSLDEAWHLIKIGKAELYVDPDAEVSQEGSKAPTGIPEKLLEDIKDNLPALNDDDFTEDGFPTAEAVNDLLELTGDDQVTQEDINSINELKKTEE